MFNDIISLRRSLRGTPPFKFKNMNWIEFLRKINNYTFVNKDDSEFQTIFNTMLSEIHTFFMESINEVDKSCWNLVRIDKRYNDFFNKYGLSKSTTKDKILKLLEVEKLKLAEIFNYWCDLDYIKANEECYNLIFGSENLSKNRIPIIKLKKDISFYRMRGVESYQRLLREDMFHIPFSENSAVSSSRYSKAGFPHLYLASSLYIAWEEIGRKDLEKANFSLFKNIRNLYVLDLSVPNNITNYTHILQAYIALFTCICVRDVDSKYHEMYVLPNLISDALLKFRRIKEKKVGNENVKYQIDGIRYSSSKRLNSEKLLFSSNAISIMYDYVFPPNSIKNPKFCPRLKKMFKLTDGFSLFLYNIHSFNFNNTRVAWTTDYRDSLFYDIERKLQMEKLERIK